MNEFMVASNSILNKIKAEFERSKPNTKKIIKFLFDIKKDKLSTPEYFELVVETFKMNPDFFMKEIYKTFRVKLRKMIGAEKHHEMERYIIEKYFLVEDEEILCEFSGTIKQFEIFEQKESGKYKFGSLPLTISLNSGNIFLTNYRIIAQGLLKIRGGGSLVGLLFGVDTGGFKRTERKKAFIESKPLFGYQFPIKNHWGLDKSRRRHSVAYFVNIGKKKSAISIKLIDKSKRDEFMNIIFNILRKDASEFLDVINELMVTEKSEKFRQRYIWGNLKLLWKSEEYLGFPESDRLNIVKETYKMDPEFFMTSIYPKMMSWNNQSFLMIREELIAQLRKEGANIN